MPGFDRTVALRRLESDEFDVLVVGGGITGCGVALDAATRGLPFLIPVLSRDGLINPKIARALGSALWMYDLTGGARIRKLHERIDKEAALAHMPTLREPNIAAAYLYYDAQADDARFTLLLARTAAEHGAVLANHCGVTAFTKDGGRVTGATVSAAGREIPVRAKTVVNAAGAFSADVRALDEG